MLRFVWRNESFRFRGFGRVRVRNETDGRPMGDGVGRPGELLAGRPSKRAPLAGLVPQGAMRGIASRRVVRSDQRLRWALERSDKLRAGFRGRPGASERGWGTPRREKLAQKSTQVIEIIGARKLVREAEKASFKFSDRRRS